MPTALSGGGRQVGGLALTFKVGHLIKRGAYFEAKRNYNVPLFDFEIGKCDILSVAMFTSYVSNSQTGWLCSQI